LKKYQKIAYIFLVIFILSIAFILFKSYADSNKNEDEKEKTETEIQRIELSFVNMFNELNNIKFENYRINTSQINKEDLKDNSSSSASESTPSSGSSSSSESSSSGDQGESQKENGSSQSSEESKENQNYEMKLSGVLTNNSDINWENLKNEVEILYSAIPSLTIDLYKININKEKITNFNQEYDNLMKAIKEENKQNALDALANLYNYLPDFIENSTDDTNEKILIKTKNNVFKAYSLLDKNDWNAITENVNLANQEFTKILTNSQSSNKNQYIINKAYVQINELQNSTQTKEKEIFLIKYKNLLEELENI
jgi:hypothetical protein